MDFPASHVSILGCRKLFHPFLSIFRIPSLNSPAENFLPLHKYLGMAPSSREYLWPKFPKRSLKEIQICFLPGTPNNQFFPTCQVRVVRFYVSLPSSSSSFFSFSSASPPPQRRCCKVRVPRRTSTAIL